MDLARISLKRGYFVFSHQFLTPPPTCHHVIERHLLTDPPPPPQVMTSFMNSPLTGTSCSSGRPSRGGQPGEAGGGEKKVEVDWTNGDGDECRGWWTGPRFYVAGWQPSSRHQQIDCVHQIRIQRLPDVDNIVVPVLQSKLHSSFSSTTALVLLTRNENTVTSAVIQLDDRYRAHGWKMMYALLYMSLLKSLFQGAVVLCLWVEPLEPGFRLTGCCNRGGRAHLDTFILLYHIKDCIITIIAYHINSESST